MEKGRKGLKEGEERKTGQEGRKTAVLLRLPQPLPAHIKQRTPKQTSVSEYCYCPSHAASSLSVLSVQVPQDSDSRTSLLNTLFLESS